MEWTLLMTLAKCLLVLLACIGNVIWLWSKI